VGVTYYYIPTLGCTLVSSQLSSGRMAGVDSTGSRAADSGSISIDAAKSTRDGGSASFTVNVLSGVATGYQWSFSAPPGAQNSPNVNFTSPTSASTSTDGHWFASIGDACRAPSNSEYTITANVQFCDGTKSAQTSLNIDAWWDPAGKTAPITISDVEFTTVYDTQLNKFVLGMFRATRVPPTRSSITINVPQDSQFYNKVLQHELVHVAQATDPAFDGNLYSVSGLRAKFQAIQTATSAEFVTKANDAYYSYMQSQNFLLWANIIGKDEKAAYAVSDEIAPKFIYQNCGRYN